MKTQDIRNMALALQAVEEASKKKMDPVGREDGDIDNDGDKDKSDDYLHNRRKAISSAVKGKGTKETVTTEALVGNQHKIDANKNGKIDAHDFKLLRKGKKVAEDVEELDELSKETLGSYVKKASRNLAGREYKRGAEKDSSMTNLQKSYKRDMGISKAVDKLTKESFDLSDYTVEELEDFMMSEDFDQLDELSKKTLTSYIKKAAGDAVTKAYRAGDVRDKDSGKNYMKALGRQIGISTATNKLTKEETAWPVFARIQEKVNQTKGATKPESMEDRFTASDKKMVDGHGGIGKKIPQDFVDDDQIDRNPNQFNAANVKVAPKRHNDQTVGDKTMPKAK